MAVDGAFFTLDSARIRRPLITVILTFLVFVFALTLRNGLEAVRLNHGWMIGDWLINYQGGFVRRGLLGEGIFQLAELLEINPDKIAVTVQMLCYTGYFWFSFLLIRREKDPLPYLFLVFSPVIYLFQIHDFAGGFRKEIIFLTLLALTVWLAKTQTANRFELWFYAILFVYPTLILSHEVIAIWLPLLLIVYLFVVPLNRNRAVILLIFLSISAAALVLALLFRGDAQVAATIAFSLREAGYMNLSAAIASLARSPSEGMAFTAHYVEMGSYLYYYPQAVLLALMAYIPVRKRFSILRRPALGLLFALSLLASTVVMYAAADWGRFIYVILVSMFLLSFLSNEEVSGKPLSIISLLVWGILLLAYTSLWFLPHSAFANPYIWRGIAP